MMCMHFKIVHGRTFACGRARAREHHQLVHGLARSTGFGDRIIEVAAQVADRFRL